MRFVSLTLLLLLLGTPLHAGRKGGALRTYGDIARPGIPIAAAMFSVAQRDAPGLLQLGATWLVTEGLTEGLKRVFNRTRPDGGHHSFPSGHTSSAFSGASYLHYRYGWQVGIPAYIAAGVVAYSRVNADRHYWTDVIAGALIANAVAYILVDARCRCVTLVPIFNARKHSFGILASICF